MYLVGSDVYYIPTVCRHSAYLIFTTILRDRFLFPFYKCSHGVSDKESWKEVEFSVKARSDLMSVWVRQCICTCWMYTELFQPPAETS